MKMDTFIRCHVRMYEYFEGVTTRLVCDNLKTGVVTHPREGEIILTADYEALGQHYMTAIMPAQVKKPKQKASVEGTVGKVATAIIAKLRNDVFYSFEDLKAAVAKNSMNLITKTFRSVKVHDMTLSLMKRNTYMRYRRFLMKSPPGFMAELLISTFMWYSKRTDTLALISMLVKLLISGLLIRQ